MEKLLNIRNAELITVVMTVSLEGEGIADNPYREVTCYWSQDGELLAKRDPEIESIISEHGKKKDKK
jgi:hypothetical protein